MDFLPHSWGIADELVNGSIRKSVAFWTRVGLTNPQQSPKPSPAPFCPSVLTHSADPNWLLKSTTFYLYHGFWEGKCLGPDWSIEQVENDRIENDDSFNKARLETISRLRPVIEIVKKHSNILLVIKSDHKILEVIKHVGFTK